MKSKNPQTLLSVLSFLAAALLAMFGGGISAHAQSTQPCDLFAAATPCVAAISTTRSLYQNYRGRLYQVTRKVDGKSRDIGTLPDGYADAASVDDFCGDSECFVTRLYDQSPNHNDLTPAPPGGAAKGPAPHGYDVPSFARLLSATAGGHKVYGILVDPGTGYRNDHTRHVPVRGEAEGMYMVTSARHLNGKCCFDFGNAETNNLDNDKGHMDAINIMCRGPEPCQTDSGLDMENGIYGHLAVVADTPFITVMGVNDGQHMFRIYQGDAQRATLTSTGPLPLRPRYSPMQQEGAIILGIGGDNSNRATGYFFEGAMTKGMPDETAMRAVQQNIAAVGYSDLHAPGIAGSQPPAPIAEGGGPSASVTGAAGRAMAVAQTIANNYDPATGNFNGAGWWISANGITALADAARALQTQKYDSIFPSAFTAAQKHFPGFLNNFYDDEGWWALAWLQVYRAHPDPKYFAMADAIFKDMQGGWTDTCGGGIWWSKSTHYKNAIANELFLSVAVGLAQASSGSQREGYLQWASKERSWFLHSGMINADSLVNDGLDDSCRNNGKKTWTYNQGVIVAGLAGYYQLTGDRGSLKTASQIAEAAVQHLTNAEGVVHETGVTHCSGDGVEFKGVLIRSLLTLQMVAPSPDFVRVVAASAESAWTKAQAPTGLFACDWSGPAVDAGVGSTISALDLFAANASLQGQ